MNLKNVRMLPNSSPVLAFLAAVLAAFLALSVPASTFAGNVTGWAWSDMPNGSAAAGRGAGWINFSPNRGPGVSVDSDGNFSGYAWSENVGWISFNQGETSICDNNANANANAKLNTTNGKVTGFARALAGNPTQAGGWDGCIKMDPAKGGGVTVDKNTCKYSGFAWGGDVMGWVKFDPKTGGVKGERNMTAAAESKNFKTASGGPRAANLSETKYNTHFADIESIQPPLGNKPLPKTAKSGPNPLATLIQNAVKQLNLLQPAAGNIFPYGESSQAVLLARIKKQLSDAPAGSGTLNGATAVATTKNLTLPGAAGPLLTLSN